MLNFTSIQAFLTQAMAYMQAIAQLMALFGAKSPAEAKTALDALAAAHAKANEAHAALQSALGS
jgi:hypothetical protein